MTEAPLLKAIILEPPLKADACVIWLHGLGANGNDFVDAVPYLNLPPKHGIRFLFPHAPEQAVTLNQGMIMPAWYDVMGLGMNSAQDERGIKQAAKRVEALIAAQIQQGILAERIILMGFSQGGALALFTALQSEYALGGVASLSAYLPLADHLKEVTHLKNKQFSIFLAHGLSDPIVAYAMGQASHTLLKEMGYAPQWHAYPMDHTVCLPELQILGQWLRDQLPESS